MICVEELTGLIPLRAGKIVGITSHRGEYCLVACEYAIYKVWDDYASGSVVAIEEQRAPTKAGAVNTCQHKNRSGEVSQGRTMYEICMDCGKRLDLEDKAGVTHD